MTPQRKRGLQWLALALLVAMLAPVLAVETGLAERWARGAIAHELEKMTGGVAELKEFRFHLWGLRAELLDLTLHGREPEGTPPLFHADYLLVDVRIVSLLGRRIALDEVRLDRPVVHVRIDADGRSNVPAPPTHRPPGEPWRERIFDMTIRELRLNDGYLLFNDVRVPLVAEGGDFRFALDFRAPPAGAGFYRGELNWRRLTLVARRYLPFPSDVALKFTLARDAFALNELEWKLPKSDVQVRADVASFTKPEWSFHYRVQLDLEDIRAILRKPNTPDGRVEVSGEGRYAHSEVSARGRYTAREIEMPYTWFHAGGIESRGEYRVTNRRLEVARFDAQALDGVIEGKVALDFRDLRFRVDSRARGMSLASVLAAVDNPGFPVGTLHWGGGVDVDSVTTWVADFKHVDSRGESRWAGSTWMRGGEVPVAARLDYHYTMDGGAVELQQSEITTPSSRLEMDGRLGAHDSGLEVRLDAKDLLPWDNFINRLRGPTAQPRRIAGRVAWRGRVSGPLSGPTFAGHVNGSEAAYDKFYWDEVEGDLTYSPEGFRLARARARRGRSSATLDLQLELDDWSFRPESQWSLEINLVRASTDGLQGLFGWSFPVQGQLTGALHGRGTRADPELTGEFDLAEGKAWGFGFERFRGQFGLRRDEIRLARAELLTSSGLPPPGAGQASQPRGNGRITGNFLLRLLDQEVAFDLKGDAIRLEQIERIQTERLPLGGRLDFQVRGGGPLRAPESQGTLRLTDFRVGDEVLGSFEGRLHSDGRRVGVELSSAMATGRLRGQLELILQGDYPLRGELTVDGLDLDPFIQTGLRLKALTGHSRVEGRFTLSGALARPETVTVQADVSQLSLNYEHVKLENVGPLRVVYRSVEVRIEQAHLRGPDTDFTISGYARFAGDRQVNLKLAGTANLQLATGFFPQLEARGAAQVNAAVEGTLASPRITGRLRLDNASANYGDFPAGLSRVTGEFIFDTSRLVFDNVTAEAGGGQLNLAGTLTYGDAPLRYDVTLRAGRIRIRYPEGLSWIAGGTLHLAGTTRAALLSGRVVVERLLMTQGTALTSLLVASRAPLRAPTTTSPFLRNLQFDIEAVSSPEARMEWTGARFESEGNLRVRGTWEHPILLGHIHLLTGEMTFRGNRYRLSRGDLNFSNPFRLDPTLDVEATTTIRQYEVTLNFTGPASRLTLAYRSDPPLPAGDIIALLALGRTGEESELRTSTATQTPELGASALLSEAISSQLGGRIERLFGISRFRVDPFLAGTGTEQNASARITIEQQVARDLTITYITNATSTQQQVIQVEYAVSRDISIVALRDQNGTFGLDVKFKKRFK